MAPFETGRRLCLLFEAQGGRFGVEATSVMEVAHPDANGASIRGHLELRDLSRLLGGGDEERPGVGLVLDVSPTLAVRVKRIVEVADVARSPFFLLPPGLGEAPAALVRGAILHSDRLYLELVAEALQHKAASPGGAVPRPIHVADQAPDRALVFSSQGRLYGIPLMLVSQVVGVTDAFCRLPLASGPVAGLFPHAQVLWPIYSSAGLLGGKPRCEDFFILTELAGQNVGLCASRVLGVHSGFSPARGRGEFVARGVDAPVLFMDLQRMFS